MCTVHGSAHNRFRRRPRTGAVNVFEGVVRLKPYRIYRTDLWSSNQDMPGTDLVQLRTQRDPFSRSAHILCRFWPEENRWGTSCGSFITFPVPLTLKHQGLSRMHGFFLFTWGPSLRQYSTFRYLRCFCRLVHVGTWGHGNRENREISQQHLVPVYILGLSLRITQPSTPIYQWHLMNQYTICKNLHAAGRLNRANSHFGNDDDVSLSYGNDSLFLGDSY